ncbi:GNAT family N-acetyltransferase [Rhodococcus sp. R1101]|uniref:GNAT family N-acetyltransferase n=1 Tax=Rhodococcus sp. R1101 TaxID=1170698 RepID=UPI0003614B74|nr:GNAT family N-acetyltransferase [Rhodococcus sp. R1101]
MTGTGRLEVRAVRQDDPLAAPLLEELAVEYSTRYEHSFEEQYESLVGYPEDRFAPPDGALLVLVEDEVPVAGGAFQRYDESTAELKRIWTSKDHRRRGLGRIVVAELEAEALRRGYTRIYLTTGWRQPEAVALYLAAGYTALFDPRRPAEEIGPHPFEKFLVRKVASA